MSKTRNSIVCTILSSFFHDPTVKSLYVLYQFTPAIARLFNAQTSRADIEAYGKNLKNTTRAQETIKTIF